MQNKLNNLDIKIGGECTGTENHGTLYEIEEIE